MEFKREYLCTWPDDMTTIYRIYPNGEVIKGSYPYEKAMEEIEYSKKYRWGTALFIGSKCVQTGYLGDERIAGFEKQIENKEI